MRVLVTGANGFLGSHLTERLVARGDAVRCLVRAQSDLRWLQTVRDRVTLCYGDLGAPEPGALEEAARDAELVFHVAGLTRRTARPRADFFRVNRDGTAALFGAVRVAAPRCRRFVYASTLAAVGPRPAGTPLVEDSRCKPVTAYGASKRAGEEVLRAGPRGSLGDGAVIVRLPGLYGPRDENMVQLFRLIARGLRPVSSRRVSLLHAADAVEGLLQAAESPRAAGEVYHLSGGSPRVTDVGRLAAAAAGVAAAPLPVPRTLGVVAAYAAELLGKLRQRPTFLDREKARELFASWLVPTDKARAHLGWTPQVPLGSGLAEACAWYRAHGWL